VTAVAPRIALIRPATAADLDAVVAIERVAFTDPPWSRDSFAALLGDPYVLFLVATASSPTPVGPAPVIGYVVTSTVADEADLANVAVAADRRRQGIGRRLVDAAIDGARAAGARTMYLEVRESNLAAVQLYHARGFVPVGRRRRYYRQPVEDALILQLTLDGASAAPGPATP